MMHLNFVFQKILDLLNYVLDRFSVIDFLALFLLERARRRRILIYHKTRKIDPTVILGDVYMDRNVSIGEGTYMNSGQIFAGENSQVRIGKFCAIGYDVHIKARSHDPSKPTRTSWQDTHRRIEADITIGDFVWIGDNVFIRQGITIGDYAIVGANSVVTKDVQAGEIVGGVPARVIRERDVRSR
jgi:maltose O-acetyltransferase